MKCVRVATIERFVRGHAMKRKVGLVMALVLVAGMVRGALGRDLAGMPWADFVKRSELVFHGVLVRAEYVDADKMGANDRVRYTYRVYDVYKGEAGKEVIFMAPSDEGINKAVGGSAIVALRQEGGQWVLSVDERSCWTYHSEMKKDFHGLPVYEMQPTLLYDMPAEFRETVEIQVRYGDELKVESKKVFTAAAVEKNLKAALAAVK